MRTCSKTTKAKLKRIPRVFPDDKTRLAYHDAMNDKPMSQARENRMLKALGLKRPPRRFYRPCLSVELGDEIKNAGIDLETALWNYLYERGFLT